MDMKYNLTNLKKCHGLRFTATVDKEKVDGIIKAHNEYIALCYGPMNIGHLGTFQKSIVFVCTRNEDIPSDIEIVPRDPNLYTDWQIGDKVSTLEGYTARIALRINDLVVPVFEKSNHSGAIRTCEELFNMGFRLILTDLEKKLHNNVSEFKFKSGDVVLVRDHVRDVWQLAIFMEIVNDGRKYPFLTTNGACKNRYNYCIPYNKETEPLLGTKDIYPF